MNAGDQLLSVPLQLFMTNDNAFAEPDLANLGVSGTNRIALFLLSQRENGAFWNPYVRALPSSFSTTLAWSDMELSELQASDLAEHASVRARAVEQNRQALLQALPSESWLVGLLSHERWRWALTMVWSRGHRIWMPSSQTADGGVGAEPAVSASAQGVMAPLIDMFDHAVDANVGSVTLLPQARDGSPRLAALYATKPMASGEAATVPYGGGGALPNARLIFDYGFCMAYDPLRDGVEEVSVPLRPLDPAALAAQPERAAVLERLQLQQTTPPRLHAGASGKLPLELLVFARLLVGTASTRDAMATELRAIMATPAAYGEGAAQMPAVRGYIRDMLIARLREYRTTREEDELLLEGTPMAVRQEDQTGGKAASDAKREATRDEVAATAADAEDGEASHRWYCAIRLRWAEKAILEHWIEKLQPRHGEQTTEQKSEL